MINFTSKVKIEHNCCLKSCQVTKTKNVFFFQTYVQVKVADVHICVIQLLAVVSELESRGMNILVLGRKHMLTPSRSWSKRNMTLIQKKAHCFFTDNM